MPSTFTTLPELWPLQPGEPLPVAAEAAFAVLEIAAAASDDAEGPLAQLGAAPDVTPEAVELGVRLRQLLAEAAATADQLAATTGHKE
ncbi:hypothetical protein KBZ12_18070 [Cyanobium sp. Cruz CV13-4-11]|jgi:hypothetical protein|uniref:hypothetical protein n=1 Tax=unclassified Cyanobium TaxID=2627006 RepID=UPI0020CEB92C|nr:MULTISPECIES: hypothetical protein [unclassified Cyanobium]MCP9902510.1 hypothetical protein [Cyanobium sp. Cruz CV11-17]MCP9921344.1 hypothetical protein [Cyanobium sp. Cruz CV13-4-11]